MSGLAFSAAASQRDRPLVQVLESVDITMWQDDVGELVSKVIAVIHLGLSRRHTLLIHLPPQYGVIIVIMITGLTMHYTSARKLTIILSSHAGVSLSEPDDRQKRFTHRWTNRQTKKNEKLAVARKFSYVWHTQTTHNKAQYFFKKPFYWCY